MINCHLSSKVKCSLRMFMTWRVLRWLLRQNVGKDERDDEIFLADADATTVVIVVAVVIVPFHMLFI